MHKHALLSQINHKNHLCLHRYPFTPGCRQAFIVKCLSQGHTTGTRTHTLLVTCDNQNYDFIICNNAWFEPTLKKCLSRKRKLKFSNLSKCLVDDGQEHAEHDKDNDDDIGEEEHWAEDAVH